MFAQWNYMPSNSDPAIDDDVTSVGDTGGLTLKQEAFAQALVETNNKAAAYRLVYNVRPKTLPNVVWASSGKLAALPQVKARVRELQQQAALETLINVREALQWQLDIATADPNEVVYVAKRACRHCYGQDHAYQWIDAAEYVAACVEALDAGKIPPTDEGGYGFTRAHDPALDCPACLSNGVVETVINDTRKLEGKARKLYKGLDYKNGVWVVQMHDQKAAWEMVCRMLGAFNDKLDLRTPAERRGAVALPDGLSEQDTARAYLAMIG